MPIPVIESMFHAYRLYEPGQGPLPGGAKPVITALGGYWWLHQQAPEHAQLLAILNEYAPDWLQWTPNDDPFWAMGQMLDQGRLTPYQVPPPHRLHALEPYTRFPRDEHTQWRLLPANAVSGTGWREHPFRDEQHALQWLDTLALTPEHYEALGKLVCSLLPLDRQGLARRLTHRGLSPFQNLVRLEQRRLQPRAPKATEDTSATGEPGNAPDSPQSLDLGPHEQPDGPESETGPSQPPPQSLDECEQRLAQARERLKREGYQSKYNDEELKAIAEQGELDDRFVVRMMETDYTGEDNLLGPPQADGSVRYWSTTFNQLENADTDPETLCGALGIEPKPGKSYTLALVDTQAPGADQSVTLVPTYEKLGEFAAKEIKDLSRQDAARVMNPEYSATYKAHRQRFEKEGRKIYREDHVEKYAKSTFDTDAERNDFKNRALIERKLGANEHFTGDGTTKNLLPISNKNGVMETFTYDKNPSTLGTLKSQGALKTLDTQPL